MAARWTYTRSALFLGLLLQTNTQGGSLRKLWEVDLRKTINPPAGQIFTGLPVLALRFSPDGEYIAASVSRFLSNGDSVTTLVVIPAQHPADDTKKFEVHGIAQDHFSFSPALTWSGSSDAIIAGGTVIQLRDGNECQIPPNLGYGFLTSGRIVAFPIHFEPTHIDFFEANCKLAESWELDSTWHLDDTSLDRGVLSVYEGKFMSVKSPSETLIVDPLGRKIVQRVPKPGVQVRFADSGKAICGGSDIDGPARESLRCFDVDTGMLIGEATTINGGGAILTAERASRIVADDYQAVRIPFSYEYGTRLKRRVVWDFRTGKDLVSWGPETQSFQMLGPATPPLPVRMPFSTAISPDGRFIAEGGNGILRLYEIEP